MEIKENWTNLAEDVLIYHGAVNVGVLRAKEHGILFDCCDSLTYDRLVKKGITKIDYIFITQHKRPNTAGLFHLKGTETQLVVPAAERNLFENVDAYWTNPKNRWHIYHHQPSLQILHQNITVSETAQNGKSFIWHEWTIKVVETPGMSIGGVSYILQRNPQGSQPSEGHDHNSNNEKLAFCGDLIYGDGQLWDLHSLQAGDDEILDYHSFLGNRTRLFQSLDALVQTDPTQVISAHGPLINYLPKAITTLQTRLIAVLKNYLSTTSLNFYYPKMNHDMKGSFSQMPSAGPVSDVPWIKCLRGTSIFIISESKAAILVDCGADIIEKRVEKILNPRFGLFNKLRKKFNIKSVEMCWISHYHDDHVDGVPRLQKNVKCPVYIEEHLWEVQKDSYGYHLPCISPVKIKDPVIVREGQTWKWHEFKLTAFYFPGQTLYHSGLFVEGPNGTAFFVGDSGSFTGIDDYCLPNRLFFRKGEGYFRCLDIWNRLKPDLNYNSHLLHPFHFTNEHLEYIQQTLTDRIPLLHQILPHENINLGLDPYWVRCYPYEQTIKDQTDITFGIEITNHTETEATIELEPVLPNSWQLITPQPELSIKIPPLTAGIRLMTIANPDGLISLVVHLKSPPTKGVYIIPIRIKWNESYWGQLCHTIIQIE